MLLLDDLRRRLEPRELPQSILSLLLALSQPLNHLIEGKHHLVSLDLQKEGGSVISRSSEEQPPFTEELTILLALNTLE